MRTRTKVSLAAGIVLLPVLVAAGLYLEWVHGQHRFAVIRDGRVYQSAMMPPDELVRVVRQRGIDVVMDFRKGGPEVEAEERALSQAGIAYRHLPSEHDPSPEAVQEILSAIGDELQQGHSLLLHCREGEGRSVMYAALYRIQFEGWSNQDAFNAMVGLPPSLWFLHRLIPPFGRMPRSNPKVDIVLGYVRSRTP